MALFKALTLLRGGGDLASGVAYRLVKAGFPVAITELPRPVAVRLCVSYCMAVTYQSVIIEGVVARRASLDDLSGLRVMLDEGVIPVVVDPEGAAIRTLRPAVVIDGRVAKVNLDRQLDDAPLVIGLGPGFTAGVDCHAVVETNRGHNLGRVYWQGSAEPDTGIPAGVNGRAAERVLRAPCDGLVTQVMLIGMTVRQGDLVARVGDQPVFAPFKGVLRGLVDDDTPVTAGMKIGDVDPRSQRHHCFTISDKSLSVGGGVVEAVLSAPQMQAILSTVLSGAGTGRDT